MSLAAASPAIASGETTSIGSLAPGKTLAPGETTSIGSLTPGKSPVGESPAIGSLAPGKTLAPGKSPVSKTPASKAPVSETSVGETTSGGWYAGIHGGVPFGVSTFSSFGAKGVNIGWNVGLFGGYEFNRFISVDISADYGRIPMSERDCCYNSGYWLGDDWQMYYSPVVGMTGWNYTDIKSVAAMQRYGIHFNADILGLFIPESRWSATLSPAVYAAGSKTAIYTLSDRARVLEGKETWHAGFGGDVSVGYKLGEHLSAALYSGLTYYTGSRIDGLVQNLHSDNYVWESGVRLRWSFGRKSHAAAVEPVQKPVEEPVRKPVEEPVTKPAEEPAPEQKPAVEQEPTPEQKPVEEDRGEAMPSILFSHNSMWVESSQIRKVMRMVRALKADPGATITLEGYADSTGTSDVNAVVSLRRAESVKRVMMGEGIDGGRISVKGCGVDTSSSAADARRVEVRIKRTEKR